MWQHYPKNPIPVSRHHSRVIYFIQDKQRTARVGWKRVAQVLKVVLFPKGDPLKLFSPEYWIGCRVAEEEIWCYVVGDSIQSGSTPWGPVTDLMRLLEIRMGCANLPSNDRVLMEMLCRCCYILGVIFLESVFLLEDYNMWIL